MVGGNGVAEGRYSTIPGGKSNSASGDFSLAAGRRAKADHDGTFVWADHTDDDFQSTSADQFLIRASGGVGIGTAEPATVFEVVCPSGFTNVKAAGNQLGCMQTEKANAGVGLSWEDASDHCFDSFGGRLPTTSEWYISMANFTLVDEIDDVEWSSDFGSLNAHAVSGPEDNVEPNLGIVQQSSEPDSILIEFRCWIPR